MSSTPSSTLRHLAFATLVPLLLILAISGFILIPKLLTTPPSQDLVYQCSPYSSYGDYIVDGNTLVYLPGKNYNNTPREDDPLHRPIVYRAHFATNTVTVVPTADISTLTLSSSRTAQDGSTYTDDRPNRPLMAELAGGDSRADIYVKKDMSTYTIKDAYCENRYSIHFLGWLTTPPPTPN